MILRGWRKERLVEQVTLPDLILLCFRVLREFVALDITVDRPYNRFRAKEVQKINNIQKKVKIPSLFRFKSGLKIRPHRLLNSSSRSAEALNIWSGVYTALKVLQRWKLASSLTSGVNVLKAQAAFTYWEYLNMSRVHLIKLCAVRFSSFFPHRKKRGQISTSSRKFCPVSASTENTFPHPPTHGRM